MADIRVIDIKEKAETRIRVCAYVRVSTRSDEQLNSYLAQKEYWENRYMSDERYEYLGIFADEGISGRSTKKRDMFNKMISMAYEDKIDLICTKSISRFARNVIDLVGTIRELRNRGVTVYFETENLYSSDTTSDLMLTLYATIAEQELTDMSENMKWSARRRFAEGRVELNSLILGYDLIKDDKGNNSLEINEEQADTVRLIYSLYIGGMGIDSICRELEIQGCKTATGKDKWGYSTILKILTNEKYTGDALLQKTYKDNYVRKNNDVNNPIVPMYYIEQNHTPIIDKDLFLKAQEIMRSREIRISDSEYNPFKGKIICGNCGKRYQHKRVRVKGEYRYALFHCDTYLQYRKNRCNNNSIFKDNLETLFTDAFNEYVITNKETEKQKELTNEINLMKDKDRELYSLKFKGYISELSYEYEHRQILMKIKDIENRLIELEQINVYREYMKQTTEFDKNLVGMFLDKAVINNDWTIKFIFKNGIEITREYNNPKPGNKRKEINNGK